MKKLSVLFSLIILTALVLSMTACSEKDAALNTTLQEKEGEILLLTKELDTTKAALNATLQEKEGEIVLLTKELDTTKIELNSTKGLLMNSESKLDTITAELSSVKEQLDALSASGPTIGATLMMEAANIIHLVHIQDFTGLSAYVDSAIGLRVSPYQYVNMSSDILLSDTDVANLGSYPMTTWGTYDGSGDPIALSGTGYYNTFMYNADFENAPYIGQNTVLSSGNMINNIQTSYPGDSFIEFYFDGFNAAYNGMDWTSITLVMRNISGQWYLVALVHGQWTT